NVGLFRLAREIAQLRGPLLELLLGVLVAEALVNVLAVPAFAVAMKKYDGTVGGGRDDRRDRRSESLRHIDAHVRKSVATQEIECLFGVLLIHPGVIAKLDAGAEGLATLGRLEDVLAVRV